jgi:hypothetical protein
MDGKQFQTCIEACATCARQCKRCLDAGIHEADLDDCVRICRECFLSCVLCLADLRDGSPDLILTCLACATTCGLCANECGTHLREACQRTASACRRCAEECRKVIASIQESWFSSAQLGN